MLKNVLFFVSLVLLGISCKQAPKAQDKFAGKIDIPVFNADSAYYYTAMQVSFGPRVPGTKAHEV